MTINLKKKKIESVGELSTEKSQIVLKCLYLARIGRLDILWSVEKLARVFTKWTKSCVKRLARLISYIQVNTGNMFFFGKHSTTMQTRIVFKTLIFAGDFEDSKSTTGEFCAFSEVTRLCQQVGCARNRLLFHTVPQTLR